MRGDHADATLDLLLNNNESIVEEIVIMSPLGKSDHGCVYVKCDLQELEARSKRSKYLYEKKKKKKKKQQNFEKNN